MITQSNDEEQATSDFWARERRDKDKNKVAPASQVISVTDRRR
jgi:hypothetical protein